jgi:hypothetical protein
MNFDSRKGVLGSGGPLNAEVGAYKVAVWRFPALNGPLSSRISLEMHAIRGFRTQRGGVNSIFIWSHLEIPVTGVSAQHLLTCVESSSFRCSFSPNSSKSSPGWLQTIFQVVRKSVIRARDS